ncbi:MAG: hypothetical protein ACKOW9_06485 [Candidatus Paceibacterota bacterium]
MVKKFFAFVLVIVALISVFLVYSKDNSKAELWSNKSQPSFERVAKMEIEACLTLSEPGNCLNKAMTELVVRYGAASVWEAYRSVQRENPVASRNCHVPGHLSGAAAYKESKSLKSSLAYLEPVCQGAYIHGVYEAWGLAERLLSDEGRYERMLQAGRPCEEAREGFATFLCYEGLGHAVWMLLADMEKSFDVCGRFSTDDARAGCVEGVVMQRYLPLIEDKVLAAEGVENVADGCKSLKHVWSSLSGDLVGKSAGEACRESASTLYIMDLGGRGVVSDLEEASGEFISRCRSLRDERDKTSEEDVNWCLDRVGWAFWYLSDASLERGMEMCELYATNKDGCVRILKETAEDNS